MVEQLNGRRNGHVKGTSARGAIASFASGQIAENGNEAFETVTTDSRKHLLADFKKTNIFRRRYSQLIKAASLPVSDDEFSQTRKRFSGAIFQDMAFMYLAQNKPESLESATLLSSRSTLQFYRKLYPWAKRLKQPFDGDSLRGISVPDGVFISGDGRVVAVCEYTLDGRGSYFENKVNGSKLGRKNLPDILGEAARLIIVTPTFPQSPPETEKVQLPFTHRQFRNFVDDILGRYRIDDECASILEIQRVMREMFQRGKASSRGFAFR